MICFIVYLWQNDIMLRKKPWNCMWLDNMSHLYIYVVLLTTLLHVFQYKVCTCKILFLKISLFPWKWTSWLFYDMFFFYAAYNWSVSMHCRINTLSIKIMKLSSHKCTLQQELIDSVQQLHLIVLSLQLLCVYF